MQEQATSSVAASSLPSSSERSSSSALHHDIKEGIESDDEIRRVPELGGDAAGTAGSAREAGSKSALDRVQASADGARKRGRSPADKENKRLKRYTSLNRGLDLTYLDLPRRLMGPSSGLIRVTWHDLDEERLLRNRVSAQQARERKKAYLIELEGRVKDLEKKNSEQEERLSTLQNENQMLRQILKNTTAGLQEGRK